MKKIFKIFIILLLFLFIANVSVGSSTNSKPNSHKPHTLKVTTVPLYRLRSDSDQDHFYTSNQFEIPEYTDKGYRFESIIGEVFTEKQPNTVPLHRLYCPSEKNHFYTIRDNYEKLVTRTYNPYIYEGVVGYVYESEVENSIPLYRLRSDTQKNHFYTTNGKEKDNATKKGYRFERIECYILPAGAENQVATIQTEPVIKETPAPKTIHTQVEYSGNFVEDEEVRIWQAHGGAIILFDFDNDNDPDIVLNGKVRADLYKNDGNGNFEWLEDDLESMDYCDAAVGDMDGDNYLDIIFAGRGKTILYSNNKDGSFSEATRDFKGLHSTGLAVGDVDGDSDLDFVVCGRDGLLNKKAHLYFNKGNNKFEESKQEFKGVSKGSVQLADMDGDNDLDILLTGNKSTFIYLNNGKGKYSEKSNSIGKYYSSDSDLADIDGDGDMDIVIIGDTNSDETSKIYLNDGNANFTDSGESLIGLDKGCAEFTDIDLDGDPDLFLSGWDGDNGKTALYLNDGSGSFTETEISLPDGRQSIVDFGDVDGDGDIDIVFGAYRGGTALFRQE
ncbi:MAG: FG-GAP-like repeat-containing protein [Candidatus Marinimicrobia bacterium]|nr:FG-GAP-like repeat-containing protein [Candidatus Neomarinimicrobiota bacterium]